MEKWKDWSRFDREVADARQRAAELLVKAREMPEEVEKRRISVQRAAPKLSGEPARMHVLAVELKPYDRGPRRRTRVAKLKRWGVECRIRWRSLLFAIWRGGQFIWRSLLFIGQWSGRFIAGSVRRAAGAAQRLIRKLGWGGGDEDHTEQ